MRPATLTRFVAIDALRFLAAMGVVAHHYSGFTQNAAIISVLSKNYLFVDFFFAISGFVIFHTYGDKLNGVTDYVDFLKNRLARIYPLHLITLLIFGLLALTIWRDKIDRAFVDPAAFLPNLFLTHAWGATDGTAFNYPSWSISAEWFAYLLFPAVVWLVRRGGSTAALVVAAACVGALEIAENAGLLRPWTTLTWNFGALRALPTFLVGAAIANSLPSIRFRLASFAPAWLLFCCACAGMAIGLNDRLIVLLLVSCLLASVIAERDGARGLLTRPIMAHFGDCSYALYMLHPLVAILFMNLMSRGPLAFTGNALVAWCIFVALVPNLVLAPLVYRGLETPARRWLRNWRVSTPNHQVAP